ncbi:hypothetical protein [Bacillus thuringiensis]|uniref:hypothetical protein n=1 Tax=Bacillus thuringiensis TaxID=1428 RepID=UPI00119F57CB|nr:hypothetical protein [Bacillus thuringiensis]
MERERVGGRIGMEDVGVIGECEGRRIGLEGIEEIERCIGEWFDMDYGGVKCKEKVIDELEVVGSLLEGE